jgi:hypothetical protein
MRCNANEIGKDGAGKERNRIPRQAASFFVAMTTTLLWRFGKRWGWVEMRNFFFSKRCLGLCMHVCMYVCMSVYIAEILNFNNTIYNS